MSRLMARLIAVPVLLWTISTPASAQSPWRVSAGGGLLEWDASGTGNSSTLVARFDHSALSRFLGIELGGAYAALDEQFRSKPTQTLALDAQLQLQTPWTRVQPYIGVGPSLFSYLTQAGGRNRIEPGYSIGAGIRAGLTRRIGLVADARVRGWDFTNATDFTVNSGGEVTLGLTFRR